MVPSNLLLALGHFQAYAFFFNPHCSSPLPCFCCRNDSSYHAFPETNKQICKISGAASQDYSYLDCIMGSLCRVPLNQNNFSQSLFLSACCLYDITMMVAQPWFQVDYIIRVPPGRWSFISDLLVLWLDLCCPKKNYVLRSTSLTPSSVSKLLFTLQFISPPFNVSCCHLAAMI